MLNKLFLPRLVRGFDFVSTKAVLVRKSRRTFGAHKSPGGSSRRSRVRESALRYNQYKSKVTRAPSTANAVPRLASARSRSGSDTTPWCHSLPSRRFATSRRKALARRFSADGGFGLLPDGAKTATRYTCPRRKRRDFYLW